MFEDFGDVAGDIFDRYDERDCVDRDWKDEDHEYVGNGILGDDDFFDDFEHADRELYELEDACFAHFAQEYQGEIGKSDMVIDPQYRM